MSARKEGMFYFIVVPDDMTGNYDTSFEVLDHEWLGSYITPETEAKGKIFLRSQIHFSDKYKNDIEDKHKHYGGVEYTYDKL